MKIDRIHHVAYRCKDAKQTVLWYQKMLNMDFVLAINEDQVPSTKAPNPYMHIFPDAGGGNVLAFFELPTQPSMGPGSHDAGVGAAHRLQGHGPRGTPRLPDPPGDQRRRGTGCHKPRRVPLDLLLRPERPPFGSGLSRPRGGGDAPGLDAVK